ncbi:MAG: hypothetical protein ETSY1_37545 [Candidatus Entotheonella factor]|uniref:Uncharacterized protein n=1 Tax=Entotheonella factor TaxID=1429438 RepID=W4L6Y3_ENTF1|nr:MAG: hypothetical protein ETSY1_37545 [Candidatus Entotheonella factor]
MAVAYYIKAEQEIAELDLSVDGKSIPRADPDQLVLLFRKLQVRPLMDFYSADPEDIADLLDSADDEVSVLPDEEWFSAAEGFHSVDVLLTYLREHDGELERQQEIIDDLESYQRILKALAERNVRWHLSIDL